MRKNRATRETDPFKLYAYERMKEWESAEEIFELEAEEKP